jgi:hypothetical protein
MNLSYTRGDDPAAVAENYRRFCVAIGVDAARVVESRQTHTVNVRNVTAADCGKDQTYTDIDGLLTDEPGVVLCTHYADCVPLFFVDPVRRVVATGNEQVSIDLFGTVTVNGEELDEPYVEDKTLGQCNLKFPYNVPANEFFVLGDNRGVAMDSRLEEIGVVTEDRLIGKVVFSLNPMGAID